MLCKCCVLPICPSVHMSMPLTHSSCSGGSCLVPRHQCRVLNRPYSNPHVATTLGSRTCLHTRYHAVPKLKNSLLTKW
jgi:hypothetical protein